MNPGNNSNIWVWNEKPISMPSSMADGQPWPRISVITPSYNHGRFIEETVRSVIMQGYPNLEYIIIDGGSTDQTVEIIKKYETKITYWVSEKDRGQTHAINKGFEKATGQILAYLNSDDLYMPYTLRLVAEMFHQYDLDWLTGIQSRLVAENVIAPKRDAVKLFNQELIRRGYHLGSLAGWNQQCSTFWSATLFAKVGKKFDESFHHAMDIDMWIRMSKFSDLVSVEATLALMRLHQDQKSRNINVAEVELSRKAKVYGHSPYRWRVLMYFLFKFPIIRRIMRWLWVDGKGRYMVWNVKEQQWILTTGHVR